MKKKIFISIWVILLLTVSGCNSHKAPVYTCEVIYQQENYQSQYAYQIYHSLLVEKPYKFEVFGMNLAMNQYDYYTVINPNGTFASPVMKSLKEVMREKRTELQSNMPDEMRSVIGELSGECSVLELEEATYVLSYGREDGNPNYKCYLFRWEADGDIHFVEFETEYSVISYSSNKVELFAVYADNSICIGDTLWFDESLNQIDKPKIKKDEYLMDEDALVSQMLKLPEKEVQELANETIYIITEGRIENMYYCFFSVPQNGDWGTENYYIAECEMDGNILSIVKIGGFETGYSVMPKKLKTDSYKYYDVKH